MVYQWSSRATVRALGLLAFLLGAVLIVGGYPRFAGAGFAVARLVPGGPYTWGTVIGLSGLSIVVSTRHWNRRVLNWVLTITACWHATFACFIAAAALSNPQSGLTGVVVYGGIALMCLIQRATATGLST